MSDQIRLSQGAAPWLPTTETEPVEILAYYDGPLLGIFLQQGVPYLFRCLAGELSKAQMWLYVTLTDREADSLRSLEGGLLDAAVDGLSQRAVTVALAGDDGLLYWENQDLSDVPATEVPHVAGRRLSESIARISRGSADLAASI